MIKQGDIITAVKLKNLYGNHALNVLSDYLQPVAKKAKGDRQRYKIAKQLPDEAEVTKLLVAKYTTTLESLITDAYAEAETLGEEMQEAYDNMPESLQQGDVGQRRTEAADACQNVTGNQPNLPAILNTWTTVFYPNENATSRSSRAGEAAGSLSHAAEAIREKIESIKGGQLNEMGIDLADLECVADTLEESAQELEEVDFPGMYG